MKISAKLTNERDRDTVALNTAGNEHSLALAPRPDGLGSSVSGGELLFLALATCFCNDLYRETKKRNIAIHQVRVEVMGEFGGEGEGARNITYSASVEADASETMITELIQHTDTVAEIHNTLRSSTPVTLTLAK
jgi:uncharacterized OsmC-like protein